MHAYTYACMLTSPTYMQERSHACKPERSPRRICRAGRHGSALIDMLLRTDVQTHMLADQGTLRLCVAITSVIGTVTTGTTAIFFKASCMHACIHTSMHVDMHAYTYACMPSSPTYTQERSHACKPERTPRGTVQVYFMNTPSDDFLSPSHFLHVYVETYICREDRRGTPLPDPGTLRFIYIYKHTYDVQAVKTLQL